MRYYSDSHQLWIHAQNPEELVTWMRLHDPCPTFSNAAFMRMYARRKMTAVRAHLSSNSETAFVKDLVKYRIVRLPKRTRLLRSLFKLRNQLLN